MPRSLRVLCAVLALCLLLGGCDALQKKQTVTCGELVLTLPASYVDLSDQDYAAGFSFVYGFENEAVLAISESRAALEAYYPDINAEKYAMLFVETNGLDSQVGKLGELVTFTYTANAEETELSYLCGVFMSGENFWCVQFYCPTEAFGNNQAEFMDYLQKIQVQETLTN
ncbi:MAG: hypothetical protein IKK41_04030 [Oscillospiraceae bacterium]|nr:hypothetical protein [Oscillospiraceae bacterium]